MFKRIGAVLFTAAVSLAAFAQTPSTKAEVRKIDPAQGKITLKHGEIKNLDMPPMTMVFTVKDKTMLEKVKAGDKVLVHIEKEGSNYVVTALQAQP